MKMISTVISRLSVFGVAISFFGAAALAQTGNSAQLNGTFRLDSSKSDDIAAMVDSI